MEQEILKEKYIEWRLNGTETSGVKDLIHLHFYVRNLKKLETAQAKKQIISQYLEAGLYNQVYLYDDSLKNIQSFVTLRSTYPKVKLVPIHVKIN